jgi:hypothetical protein
LLRRRTASGGQAEATPTPAAQQSTDLEASTVGVSSSNVCLALQSQPTRVLTEPLAAQRSFYTWLDRHPDAKCNYCTHRTCNTCTQPTRSGSHLVNCSPPHPLVYPHSRILLFVLLLLVALGAARSLHDSPYLQIYQSVSVVSRVRTRLLGICHCDTHDMDLGQGSLHESLGIGE